MDTVTLEGIDPDDLVEMGQGLITAGIALRNFSEGEGMAEDEIRQEARGSINETVRQVLQACGIEVN